MWEVGNSPFVIKSLIASTVISGRLSAPGCKPQPQNVKKKKTNVDSVTPPFLQRARLTSGIGNSSEREPVSKLAAACCETQPSLVTSQNNEEK